MPDQIIQMIACKILTILIKKKYVLYTKHMDKTQGLSITLFTGLIYKSKALYQVLLNSVQNNKASSTVHETGA